jgi:hypothetical protein
MPELNEEDAKTAWRRRREERQREREQKEAHPDGKETKADSHKYQPFVSAAKRRRTEQESYLLDDDGLLT